MTLFAPADQLTSKKTTHLPMPDLNEFMTVQEAADKLGFNEQSVRHLFRQGTLEGKKIQRTILIYKSSLAAYQSKTKGMNKNDPRRRTK
jgi:excisionase family DNA binding protein